MSQTTTQNKRKSKWTTTHYDTMMKAIYLYRARNLSKQDIWRNLEVPPRSLQRYVKYSYTKESKFYIAETECEKIKKNMQVCDQTFGKYSDQAIQYSIMAVKKQEDICNNLQEKELKQQSTQSNQINQTDVLPEINELDWFDFSEFNQFLEAPVQFLEDTTILNKQKTMHKFNFENENHVETDSKLLDELEYELKKSMLDSQFCVNVDASDDGCFLI